MPTVSSSRPETYDAVSSDQRGPHPRLASLLRRHRAQTFLRPCPAHATAALLQIERACSHYDGRLVLDSGCGTGTSTLALAHAWPRHLVVGVDKSAARLARAASPAPPPNLLFVRTNLVDLWLTLSGHGITVRQHYLFYPNPWPKQAQIMRRWHAHPIMPTVIALGGNLEMRTNWKIYAEEFALALAMLAACRVAVEPWQPPAPISAFERKYLAAQAPLYRVRACLTAARGDHAHAGC